MNDNINLSEYKDCKVICDESNNTKQSIENKEGTVDLHFYKEYLN